MLTAGTSISSSYSIWSGRDSQKLDVSPRRGRLRSDRQAPGRVCKAGVLAIRLLAYLLLRLIVGPRTSSPATFGYLASVETGRQCDNHRQRQSR